MEDSLAYRICNWTKSLFYSEVIFNFNEAIEASYKAWLHVSYYAMPHRFIREQYDWRCLIESITPLQVNVQ